MVSIVAIQFIAYTIIGCLGLIFAGLYKPDSAVGRWFNENDSHAD